MDSLTQITLGAAVGELVLGRKLGNRAMMWGAIGGTIPDLDIVANFFVDNVTALAFHRGISHSLIFSILAPFPIAWLVNRLYDQKTYQNKNYKWFIFILNSLLCLFVGGGLSYLGFQAKTFAGIATGSIFFGTTLYFIYRIYKYYLLGNESLPKVQYKEFYWLFCLAFATHWMLDCFTAYGTQIFQPFSEFRVAFNNISVADPAYTIPFLICIIIGAFFHRSNSKRRKWVWAGLVISSLYMSFTIFNKISVDRYFKKALELEGIEPIRYRTSPTILNNVLWGCVAETEFAYHIGLHSRFDKADKIPVLNIIPKNHHLINHLKDHPQINILQWFTDGYYTIYQQEGGNFVLSDLRYGALTDRVSGYQDFVFNFFINKTEDGIEIIENRARPDNPNELITELWTRIKGR